ncbi:MAG: hypothetical protein M1826_002981 [Phylliscum demangeonii]|nr:MAG: hypothetical protein M1826_002981 [Phylliscum demangeonii]
MEGTTVPNLLALPPKSARGRKTAWSKHDEAKVGALKKSLEARWEKKKKVRELERRLDELLAAKDASLTELVPTAATTAVTLSVFVDEAAAAASLMRLQEQATHIAHLAHEFELKLSGFGMI